MSLPGETVTDRSAQWVTLAELLRPQGRRGEILAELRTSNLQLLDARDGVYLVGKGSDSPVEGAERVRLESHWQPTGRNAGRIVVKLAGCDSIDDAEQLAGARLMIPAAERPALAEGEYYISDLIGCALIDGNVAVGIVEDVEFAASSDGHVRLLEAAPLLAVQRDDAEELLLVPLVAAWLDQVDIPGKRIVMRLPAGLLDEATAE